ncbi:Xaa-Pro aminopeptidase [Thorsellia anophelis]|uniref:Xaa-Pro aminopeptidase n=1 Tax=Thorsellia anophelis DSM 18579 TaxID=1123402 RepID=A0A1I0A8J6_9GAMM|nr:Xaa-Pro aminopeptidase [Thorsellia anophelis]SES89564.1 aminopeptidase P . Metallo peptidase. MEROPS family M24B [Thorsellia anophelis DSM 18579]
MNKIVITPSEFQARRQKLAERMVNGSAIVIFSAKEVVRNSDSHYLFRQDSDFWYLTGFDEPDSVFIMIKSNEQLSHTIIFNRERDLEAEIWNGKRLGQEEAISALRVDRSFKIEELKKQLPLLLNGLDTIYHAQGHYDYGDKVITEALSQLRNGSRHNWVSPTTMIDWRPIVHEMRLFKSANEIDVMREACEITAKAHLHAMRVCQPNMTEGQLEGEIHYHFSKQGARNPSYNTIVGGGENACILHYTQNNQILKSGQLVLVDAGAEYQNYAGDITRTFPINGKFSKPQRDIYELVLKMQLTALQYLKPGHTIYEANLKAIDVLIDGLLELGILVGDKHVLLEQSAHRKFYMHGLSHWLGLDVHDVGDYGGSKRDRVLEPGMVLTVEPGIYIAPDAKKIPAQYLGIGIRIEDNIVITETGHEILTQIAIKDPDEIELWMSQAPQNKAGV